MRHVAVFSPAKVNLFLAVTGRRPDGFHDLVSLVAPVGFGDTIWLHAGENKGGITLVCTDPAVPAGPDNLAVRAAEAFRALTGIRAAIAIELEKRIPMGAGLGGGSSNAASVLRGLNTLFGEPLRPHALAGLAASLGSDCPLFLVGGACVMRGRGERIEALPIAARQRLDGTRLILFKPDFSIGTPWAYARLAARGAYMDAAAAEARLSRWMSGELALAGLLCNSFEEIVHRKFVALPALAEKLRRAPGVDGVLLSGSGSASLVLLGPVADVAGISAIIRDALGSSVWIAATNLIQM